MLKPHPTVLRRLVEEYETLTAAGTGTATAGGPTVPNARINDLAYTLCVSTGTRDVRHALATARRWLAGADDLPAAGRRDAGAGAGAPAAV
ncbi:DUF5133 domain-containing protein [Streptomyces calvus]|uniref:DUF5133 domain-containing protein n=1 Tax=Streptomyces calvus TaxID=67282 RepID=UPI00371FF6D8